MIVGTGDPVLASQLKELSALHSDKFSFVEAYNNELAHLVETGSDFFLMPSEFEPCGLNQIYSMAYGTLPIVRSVGGLKDSVNDYDPRILSSRLGLLLMNRHHKRYWLCYTVLCCFTHKTHLKLSVFSFMPCSKILVGKMRQKSILQCTIQHFNSLK